MSQHNTGNTTKVTGNTPQSPLGDAGSSAPTPTAAAPKTWAKECAVLVGSTSGPVIASGKTLGMTSKISASLVASRVTGADHWMGLSLEFPLDQAANETSGFGVRHQCKYHAHMPNVHISCNTR